MKTRLFLLTLTGFAGTLLTTHAADPAPTVKPPATSPDKKMETVTLATGCFWCTEVILQRTKGVQSATSGYLNGKTPNPTYEDVCTGLTGHAEAVEVVFDPAVIPFETLAHLFFEMHDPTTLNAQGNDHGTQYRSGIFYHTDEQKAIAEKVKAEVGASGKFKSPIVTEITKAGTFYKAGIPKEIKAPLRTFIEIAAALVATLDKFVATAWLWVAVVFAMVAAVSAPVAATF
jgi:peptide-methionine (S)-S-oxide reductase